MQVPVNPRLKKNFGFMLFFLIACAITTFDKAILETLFSDLPVTISSALVAKLEQDVINE